MNPILREAIAALSCVVNTSSGLAHPLDDSRAKGLFKALHKQGVHLDEGDVFKAAIDNGWPERHAKSLSALASKISNGGRVQIKHPKAWCESTVRKIISDLQDS